MIPPINPIYLIEQIIDERINNPRKEKKRRGMHHMFVILSFQYQMILRSTSYVFVKRITHVLICNYEVKLTRKPGFDL